MIAMLAEGGEAFRMPTQGRYLEYADSRYRCDQRAAALPVDSVCVRRAAEGFALDCLIYTHDA